MKNGTPLWREAHFQVKMHKTPHGLGAIFEVPMSKNGTPLWREAHLQVKMHKTPHARERFLKFRCPKMARCCGAKHICKSKCTKHHTVGAIFEVPIWKNGTPLWREAPLSSQNAQNDQMFKNGTPLWRETHLQVKMYKTHAFCSILKGF